MSARGHGKATKWSKIRNPVEFQFRIAKLLDELFGRGLWALAVWVPGSP